MPFPPALTLTQLQTNFLNAWAATLNPSYGVTPTAIPVGDPVRALGFANSAATAYLDGRITQLVDFSRAATSDGPDLDSWLADFNYKRAPGSPATWIFTIPTADGQAVGASGSSEQAPVAIPQGTVIQTQAIVVAPSTVPTVYRFITTAAAAIGLGQSSVQVQAQAQNPGSAYNGVPTTTPFSLGTGIAGAGTPTVASQVTLGSDPATDPQARSGFVDYITSLELATLTAFKAAVEDAVGGLVYGQTFQLYDGPTIAAIQSKYPGVPLQINGIAASAAVPNGYVACVYLDPNYSSGRYSGSPDNPTADAILAAMQATAFFSCVPVVYYAPIYLITAATLTVTVSASQLAAAGLNQSQIPGVLQGILDTQFQAGMGTGAAMSEILAAVLNYSVTLPSTGAVVSGIFTDANIPSLTVTVNLAPGGPGGAVYTATVDDQVLPSTTHGVPDLTGVLRLNPAGAYYNTFAWAAGNPVINLAP